MSTTELRYDSADTLLADEIPVIDLAPFLHGDAAARAGVAAAIAAACERIGFFYVINHGVPEGLRQAVLEEARGFFARPLAEKMACAPIADGRWCGYLPGRGAAEGTRPGGSLTAEGQATTSVSGGTLQQFNMMRVLPADDANYGNPDLLYQRNPWPAGQPGFVETMVVNQRALLALGAQLMRAFAIALGLEETHFLRLHQSPLATFGLNYYPRPVAGAASADVGVGAHCDASSFTVLLQDEIGGLEVQTRDGRWIAAPVVPGAYVINIGDT
ncbi:MAG TPA: 2-oxoglutarate and iron-dependent oxygenase domain-containing protein, partial [Novosphingobium sp.]|nr:2-oxoglutarate and iron-dependent oxygenase domain-containing protein [Novosphingobium sp.]